MPLLQRSHKPRKTGGTLSEYDITTEKGKCREYSDPGIKPVYYGTPSEKPSLIFIFCKPFILSQMHACIRISLL
jgi:hypothetical protein